MENQDKRLDSEILKRNLDAINVFMENMSKRCSISFDQIINLLKQKEGQKIVMVPSFIFRERNIGILEALAKYLKEELNLKYHEIAEILNRDERVVWVSYNKSIKKKKEKFAIGEPNSWIPVYIFADRRLSPFGAVCKYIVDFAGLNFAHAAMLLNRDSRSIWACYNKSKKKMDKHKEK